MEVFPVKRIVLASDHGGYYMKETLTKYLRDKQYTVRDLGPFSPQACDYPDYAFRVAEAVAAGEYERGIMIDSVGIGSAMAANRVTGILAAKCNNGFEARSAREHNNANVLTLGAKIIGIEVAKSIVQIFLDTPAGGERHQRRVHKILNY
ncbi:MAG: ribose 5-phosphate isomerase B [Caldithrix sp.]|nr:ribose 5-phosphate isomerase B [Caldithrix sp.]